MVGAGRGRSPHSWGVGRSPKPSPARSRSRRPRRCRMPYPRWVFRGPRVLRRCARGPGCRCGSPDAPAHAGRTQALAPVLERTLKKDVIGPEVAKAVAAAVQPTVAEAFNVAFQATLLPAFERVRQGCGCPCPVADVHLTRPWPLGGRGWRGRPGPASDHDADAYGAAARCERWWVGGGCGAATVAKAGSDGYGAMRSGAQARSWSGQRWRASPPLRRPRRLRSRP